MSKSIGYIFAIFSIIVALYVGVWWAIIGGIVEIIKEIRAPEMDASRVTLNVARIIFGSILGALAGIVGALPGVLWKKWTLTRKKSTIDK